MASNSGKINSAAPARPAAPGRAPVAPAKPSRPALSITSPASLLAIVPHLLTFQPRDSLVVIGTEGPRARVRLTLRYDLPDPADPEICAEIAEHATGVLSAQRIETAAVVGYGPGVRVTPLADALQERSPEFGVHISELLRVEGQRYWSYMCENPECCPPEGTPFTVENHPATEAFAAGGAPVLASREELAATLAPVGGAAADLMHQATRTAEERAARLVARVARSGHRKSARRLIAAAGTEAVIEAVTSYRNGDPLPAGNAVAWLSVMLRELRVRDDAWARMDPGYKDAHLRLWTDLTRLARPGYIAPPAALLAFVAWQAGNGALANVALDRALSDDPGYTMAHLLRRAIDSGAPPSMARSPMTPEEVAAVYDAEAAPDDDRGCDGCEDGCDGDDLAPEGGARPQDG
jgi:hypothetical protein